MFKQHFYGCVVYLLYYQARPLCLVLTGCREVILEELEGSEGGRAADKTELFGEEVTLLNLPLTSLQVTCREASYKS